MPFIPVEVQDELKITPSREPWVIGDRLVPGAVDVELTATEKHPALYLRLELVDGVPRCVEMKLTAAEGHFITPGHLKGIRLQELVDDFYAAHAYRVTDDGDVRFHGPFSPARRQAASALEMLRRDRPRKLTRDFLAGVAELYREHLHDRPTATVATVYGVSHRTAADWVSRCRRLGLLPPTKPGQKKA